MLTAALAVGVFAVPTATVDAATTTVGDGLTTTDLGAVGMSPGTLASALVGPGVTVSNVTYSGASAQAGLIHLVDPAVVSFNDGIILSSGNIADVVGPNKSDGITGDMAGPADADLTALIANTQTVNPMTYDAASLEFDFVPSSSEVYFTYTFASDEYLEWVNLFNDVFAFYVNGQNCATVPNGDPVSIDTINSEVNPGLFRDNSYSSPPANPINIESDGLSVEMVCAAPVVAGQANHMKLAIADTSDQILDSVVMIKAHSLSTTKPESCNDGVDNDDDALVDGDDDSCTSSTTPPPTGSSGIGSSGSAPAFTGNEGTPITLDASALGWTASPDTLTTSWTVTGINGTPGTCEVSPAGALPLEADGSIAVVTATCPNEGEYVARVDGWDVEAKGSFDVDVDFFVHNAPPAVAIDSPLPGAIATSGVPVALAASVTDPGASDAVTCEISWGDGATEAGVLVDGSCTGAHTYTTAGTQLLSVTATDDAGDAAAAATMVSVATAATTTTTLTSNVNPSVVGQRVTFKATVKPVAPGTGVPAGTVTFYDGATPLITKSLTNGAAAISAKPTVGTHVYTAAFSGSAGFSASATTAGLAQVVAPADTKATVTSSVNPSVVGQPVVVKAAVTAVAPGGGVPTGTVTFYDGTTPLITKPLTKGVAAIKIKPSVGHHSYTVAYSGSASHLPVTSASPLTQVVEAASTAVSVHAVT